MPPTIRTLRTPSDLIEAGLVEPAALPLLQRVAERYAVAITPAMAELIDPADPADPIGQQFLPSSLELRVEPGERPDPIGDDTHSPVPGIVHRYRDRVLLKIVHACPVYCRFCFRRETVGPGGPSALSGEALERALGYIQATAAIWEVILTGGDPLILSPRRIGEVTSALGAITHVKVLRWHTRVPVVEPERVKDDLLAALKASPKTVWVAIHVNHPRELTGAARAAITRLADAGIPLVSQTVLLKGINDDADTLEALMRAFVELRIKPYYLHHGDLAPGTSHFRTGIAEGQDIVRTLIARTSGLCHPTYVLDIPGGHGKAPIAAPRIRPSDARGVKSALHSIQDPAGRWHVYPPEGG